MMMNAMRSKAPTLVLIDVKDCVMDYLVETASLATLDIEVVETINNILSFCSHRLYRNEDLANLAREINTTYAFVQAPQEGLLASAAAHRLGLALFSLLDHYGAYSSNDLLAFEFSELVDSEILMLIPSSH